MSAFFPERLAQARVLRRMTAREVAEAIGTTTKVLSTYETGRAVPPDLVLAALARAVAFPVAFFEQPMPGVEPVDPHFRSLKSAPARERERVLALAALFHEFMDRVAETLPLKEPNLTRAAEADRDWDEGLPPQDRAGRVEAIESLAVMARRRWGLGDGPIPDMVRLLEANGVWVQILRGEAVSIDAFSYWRDGRPTVVLNHAKGDPCRSRYDAAHEVGHLIMHAKSGTKEHETDANLFAGAFLLPKATWSQTAPRSTNPWHYLPLKARWRASVACMLYRSWVLGILGRPQFESAMVRYSSLGWRSNGEPPAEGLTHERPVMLSLCVKALGARGLQAVADAMSLPGDLVGEMYQVHGLDERIRPPRPTPAETRPTEREASHLRLIHS